jgi:hypothetical protein
MLQGKRELASELLWGFTSVSNSGDSVHQRGRESPDRVVLHLMN